TPPRRADPAPGPARPGPGAGAGLRGPPRARRPARGEAALRRGRGPGGPPDPRLRGVSGIREPPQAREARRRPGRLLPHRAARQEPCRLLEPDQALLDRLPRGLLPAAADRPRSAGAAPGRADRAGRLSLWGDRAVPAAGELRVRQGERAVFRAAVRP